MSFWSINFIRKDTWLPVIALFVVSTIIGFAQWMWVQSILEHAERAVTEFANHVGTTLANGDSISESIYQDFLSQEPRVGYVAIANFQTGYRDGATNTVSLQNGAKEVEEFLKKNGTKKTLEHIVHKGSGFPSEYLHVVSAIFVPKGEVSDVTPMGILKVGYVLPGYIPGVGSLGRGFQKLILGWWVFSLVLSGVLIFRALRKRPIRVGKILSVETAPNEDDLEWLEQEMEKKETQIIDEQGRPWRLFFNEINLEGWKVQGTWYVFDHEIVARPWGASLVREETPEEKNYTFQVQAKKIAGSDGFVLLFPCDDKFLSWILGGWRNTRSELAGYAQTSKPSKIDKNKWYLLEVRVTPEWVEGFVNGKSEWKIGRDQVQSSSPEAGFQQGLGVAVWSALARYRDFRFLPT